MLEKSHARSRTERSIVPSGRDLVSHDLPALRTGLLSNVPAGRALTMATVNLLNSSRSNNRPYVDAHGQLPDASDEHI
jgi:hypothetical protein